MNPRKRRMIRRAILAGIPKSKLTPENIVKFLEREKEKGRIDLTEENIQDILFPRGFVNKPISTTSTEDVTQVTEATEPASEETKEVEEPETIIPEEMSSENSELSLDNTKAELQEVADSLNISYKKSFSKSKLLELINNN